MFIFIEGGAEVGKTLLGVLCVKQLQGSTENKQGLLIIMNTF